MARIRTFKNLLNFLFFLCTILNVVKCEQYPDSFTPGPRTVFESFVVLGKLIEIKKHTETKYKTELLKIQTSLLAQPLFGFNQVLGYYINKETEKKPFLDWNLFPLKRANDAVNDDNESFKSLEKGREPLEGKRNTNLNSAEDLIPDLKLGSSLYTRPSAGDIKKSRGPERGTFTDSETVSQSGDGVKKSPESEKETLDVEPASDFEIVGQSADGVRRATEGESATSTTAKVQTTTTTPQITNSTAQCIQDNLYVFANASAGQQWALQFLDSWGKPGSGLLKGQLKFVGDYHECRSSQTPASNDSNAAGYRGNYCVVAFSPAAGGLPDGLVNLLASSSLVEIGACMPDTCTPEGIFVLFQEGLVSANLTSVLTVSSVDCRTDEREYTAASVVAILFLSIIAVLMLTGTAYDLLFIQRPEWLPTVTHDTTSSDSPNSANENRYGVIGNEGESAHPATAHQGKGSCKDGSDSGMYKSESNDGVLAPKYTENAYKGEPNSGARVSMYSENLPLVTKKTSKSEKWKKFSAIVCKVLLAFSMLTNGQKALNTAQTPGSLTAIHGIRFLSMCWVVLGHIYAFEITVFKNLATEIPALTERWTFDVITNALFSVDTFFTLSGLLTAYTAIPEIMKKGWKINWAMFYFHRFWRLTPAYMLVLVVTLGLQRFLGSGALWASTQPSDKRFCEDNWWANLLYVNNFFHTDQLCMAHSWYLANDMQFYILSPLMMLPFYFNAKAGIGSCLLFLTVSWITTGSLSTENYWTSSIMTAAASTQSSLSWLHYYYLAPYCRIGPFIVGILAGYLLAVTKGTLHLKWYAIILGWTAAFTAALAVVYGVHGDLSGDNPSSVGVSSLYNTVARSVWGACVCWVIAACAGGYGGPVNTLLSWPPFVSLGRLTYISYLIHPTVIRVYFENMEQLFYLNETNMVITFLGVLAFTNMAAFVLMLAIESPMIALEKVFLRH